MNCSLTHLSVLALTCAATTALGSVTVHQGKAEFLAAIHADTVNPAGLATAQLTPRTAISATGNGRSIVIDSDIGGAPRLFSWGNGIGAPNPANITRVTTNGRPTNAFGCSLRVANNLNQSVGGSVQITINSESFYVTVPPSGMYLAFTSTTSFDYVNINALSGTLVEMIDDVLIADAAGSAASEHAADAGRVQFGHNRFDTRWTREDQFPFFDSNGVNRGNSRDVWWTFVAPPQRHALSGYNQQHICHHDRDL